MSPTGANVPDRRDKKIILCDMFTDGADVCRSIRRRAQFGELAEQGGRRDRVLKVS